MLLYRNLTTCSENACAPSPTTTSPMSNACKPNWLVRNGGLGVLRVSSLAHSAFLTSAAGTCDLQGMILSKCYASIDSTFDNVLVQWKTARGQSSPVSLSSSKQHAWDKPSIAADLARLNTSLSERHHQARLLAVSAPHSGDWLHALPISSCGLRLDDDVIKIMHTRTPTNQITQGCC